MLGWIRHRTSLWRQASVSILKATQAVGLLRSVFINCGTVATVPSNQMTNRLVLNSRVRADCRKKAAGEHVVYHMPHSLGQHVMPGNCFRATAPQHRWGPSLRMRHRRDRGARYRRLGAAQLLGMLTGWTGRKWDAGRLERSTAPKGPSRMGLSTSCARRRPRPQAGHGFSYAVNFSFPHRNLKFNLVVSADCAPTRSLTGRS